MNIAALLAGLFSGLIGSMGLGGGAVLIIYLTVFADMPQLKAQGINLLFFIPIALLSVTVYAFQKKIKWSISVPMAAGGVLGALAGIFLADFLGGKILGYMFGAFLIVLGLKEVFSFRKRDLQETK